MFAGIHQIILDEEQTQVLGIASKEGEEVSGLFYAVDQCVLIHGIIPVVLVL